jgi:hypothetical protein
VENIDSVDVLKEIVSTEADMFVKRAALGKIDDVSFVAGYENDLNELVSEAAKKTYAMLTGDAPT